MPILIFLLSALVLLPCAQGLAKPPEALDLMSFNIRNGTTNDGENHWKKRKTLVFQTIRDHAPDVLALQEATRFQLDGIQQELPTYAEVGTGAKGGESGQYNAILYRKERFQAKDSGTFWLSETPEKPSAHWGNHHFRICTWILLEERDTKQAFYVYNLHLDDGSQPSREKAIQSTITHYLKRRPTAPLLLMGDLNVPEENPIIHHLTGEKHLCTQDVPPLLDPYRHLHPTATDVGTYHGFTGKPEGGKIDYLFIPKNTQVLSAEILKHHQDSRYPSDHFPITARILLPQ